MDVRGRPSAFPWRRARSTRTCRCWKIGDLFPGFGGAAVYRTRRRHLRGSSARPRCDLMYELRGGPGRLRWRRTFEVRVKQACSGHLWSNPYSPSACEAHPCEADEVICAVTPEPFMAVGGSGSSRFNPRNRFVARVLNEGEARSRTSDTQRCACHSWNGTAWTFGGQVALSGTYN
jgi:hypothetical protein